MSKAYVVPALPLHDEYDAYLDALPEAKRSRVMRQSASMQTGLQTVAPLTCPGPKRCRFIAHCPIPDRDAHGELVHGPAEDYPIGRPCVMETLYMRGQIQQYYRHLQVDVENPIEVALVNELALIDLYKNRATMVMSAGDRQEQGMDLLRQDVIGITDNGKQLTSTQLHPAFTAIEQLERRRQSLLERLLETRKAKAELAKQTGAPQNEELFKQLTDIRELLLTRGQETHTLGDEIKLAR